MKMSRVDLLLACVCALAIAACSGRRGGGDDDDAFADADADADADTDPDTDLDPDADPDPDANPDPDPDPTLDAERHLDLVSGDGQFMLAFWPAGEPLIVRVTDGAGRPVPGESVTWVVTEGALAGPEGEGATDVDGLARKNIVGGGIDQNVSFTRQRVTASLADGQSVEFRATTTHTGGNGQLFEPSVYLLRPEGMLTGRAGEILADALQVQVALTTGPDTGHGLSEIAARLEVGPDGDPDGPRASCVGGSVWTGDDGIAHCDVELAGPPGQSAVRLVTGGARVHTVFLTLEP